MLQILRNVKNSVLLLNLAGCASFNAFSMTEQSARAGYAWAAMCIGYAEIPYDDIKQKLVNGDYFSVRIKDDSEKDTVLTGLIGFADISNKRVMIAKPYRHNSRLWAHEYLHYLPKVKNHPDSLFERCNLR